MEQSHSSSIHAVEYHIDGTAALNFAMIEGPAYNEDTAFKYLSGIVDSIFKSNNFAGGEEETELPGLIASTSDLNIEEQEYDKKILLNVVFFLW